MILGFFQNFEPPNIVKTPGRVASIPGISYKFSYIAQFESPSGWIRIPTGMMEDHGVRNMMGWSPRSNVWRVMTLWSTQHVQPAALRS